MREEEREEREEGEESEEREEREERKEETFTKIDIQITWTGWQYLSLNISTATAGYWNGANDGVPHFPLKWSSYLFVGHNCLW